MRRTFVLVLAASCSGGAHHVEPPRKGPPAIAAPRDPMTAASMMQDIAWLCDDARAGRGSRTADARATATWLEGELRAAHLDVTEEDIPSVPGQVDVIGVYSGTADAPALLLVAHYDHLGRGADGAIYRGADDNASGVATLLAVARDLGAARTLKRPVVFLFTGAEEIGLDGSQAYAQAPLYPLAKTRAVVNLDMVGRRFFELAIDRDAAIGAVGLDDDPALAAAARTAAKAAGTTLIETTPALLFSVGEAFRGDDWNFRSPSLPTLHLSTGLHDDYHRPSDTPDKLSRPQLERAARLVRGVVTELDAEIK